MGAYLIAGIDVTDPKGYEEHRYRAPPSVVVEGV
jgi:uncharacterized protein (DUF1330 family)